ncbi:MAG: phosphohydrolase [Bacteroidetes bacterium GWF2_49_14]|nr:MAG: phosphohydrolase [Bacteroidetes bacterium GWF2_49_14]HBB91441.1 phosphohydrolase [Bacteroidales bacterium]
MKPDPIQILGKYYAGHSLAGQVLLEHSTAVMDKALQIAGKMNLSDEEKEFISDACILHDIGILYTHAPEIGCYGELPYISHGYMGHDLLVSEGLPLHALVCERHTGAGITIDDIDYQHLPIPRREMVPVTLAEKIIAYSDKFFSKDPSRLSEEKSYEEVLFKIGAHGSDKAAIFAEWHKMFNL